MIEFLSLLASKESVVVLLRRKREKNNKQFYGRLNKVKMQREIDDDLHQTVWLRGRFKSPSQT